MKPIKIILPVALVAVLIGGWISTFQNLTANARTQAGLTSTAEWSFEEGLYEQSIQQYKEVLAQGGGVEVYERIREVYDAYMKEEPHNDYVHQCYLDDMTAAYTAYPERADFWELVIDDYMDQEDYQKAFSLIQAAHSAGVATEKIDRYYEDLRYRTTLSGGALKGLRTAMNGYYIAQNDDDRWAQAGVDGSLSADSYQLISPISDGGVALYVGELGPRLYDADGVTRARFDDLDITDAGIYDEESGLIAVRVGSSRSWQYLDVWTTLDLNSTTLLEGSYDEAGSFVNGRAAVRKGNAWYLIDRSGNVVSEEFQDIKLDTHDRYLQQGSVVFAKRDGVYAMYDADLNRLNDFTCDDIDLYLDGPIAYQQDERWGYLTLDNDGNATVVVEPSYPGAKSFAYGMAAVSDDGRDWGFINGDFQIKIKCAYRDAFYFVDGVSALVSPAEDLYQFITFEYA